MRANNPNRARARPERAKEDIKKKTKERRRGLRRERVHAAVQPRAGVRLTAENVTAFARRHLAGYKVPREVTFHEDFPRDHAGKLLKRVLREPYWAGRATRV